MAPKRSQVHATPRSRCASSLAFLLLCGALAGCARQPGLATSFPVNRGEQVRAVLHAASARPRPAFSPVVVGTTPESLFAYDLSSRRLLFELKISVTGTPALAGDLVVVPEADRIRARRLSDGRVVAELARGAMHLVGADGDGTTVAIALSTGGTFGGRSRLVILEHARVRADFTTKRTLGRPAVLGGMVFLPHSRVHLSALTGEGQERARLRVHDDVASFALVHGQSLYFGQEGLFRLDEKTINGVQGGAMYFAPDAERRKQLPGAPAFLPDTSKPAPGLDSAVHRIGLAFSPEVRAGELSLQHDALYLLFYRQLYALGPGFERAHWAYQTASDVVGMQATDWGLALVEERGAVTLLNAAGQPAMQLALPVRPVFALIRADALPVPAAPAHASDTKGLSTQLADAALSSDTRLVPAQRLAVDLLSQLNDEHAAQALVSLCSQRDASARVRALACQRLSERPRAGAPIVAALEQHGDYLARTAVPPLGPLAQAAARAGDPHAVPRLLEHLHDPATPAPDLLAVVRAVGALGGPEQVPALLDFLRLYHADDRSRTPTDALIASAEAAALLDREAARPALRALADDPLTEPRLRAELQRVTASLELQAPDEEAEEAEEAASPSASPPSPQDAAAPAAQPPERLSHAHVEATLAPVRAELSACLRADVSHPLTARLTIIVAGDGEVLAVRALPQSVQSCVQRHVRGLRFPATQYGKRDTLIYEIMR